MLWLARSAWLDEGMSIVRLVLNRRFRRSTIIVAGLAGIMAGLIAARWSFAVSTQLVTVSLLLAPMIFIRRKAMAIVIAAVVGLSIGLWRGGQVYAELQSYEALYGRKITLSAQVSDDAAYNELGQTEFHISKLILHDEKSRSLIGRVRVRAFGVIGLRRGDKVRVTGKIYPTLGNRQGNMSFASVEIISRNQSFVEDVRARFFAGVYTALPEPNASLGLGFLVGLRTLLPPALLDQLSITGLTHIVAVSGYNLTILVRITRRLFAGRSIFLSIASSFALIAGFLLVTGISPSIARAAVVSGFALAAWYYGRNITPTMLLLLGASITAFISPFYVWFDLGWHLSFSAFFGVLVIAPLITRRLFSTKPKLLGQIAIETTSAQIMALPIIAVVFGELSLISVVANIIILPLIPLAMLLTFVAGIGGSIDPSLASWLAWPANAILTFMTDSISLMSEVSWALLKVDLGWLQAGLFYVLVMGVAVVFRLKTKRPLSGAELIE